MVWNQLSANNSQIIAQAVGGSAIETFWSGTSFLLTSTVLQPIVGSFSTIFGRKAAILISLVFFGVGAIIAAVAKSIGVILVGRSIQGVGGGGIITLSEIVITDMVPLRERGKWFSVQSAMWSIGTVVGPLLGGGFAQNVDWTWIFWINLPFIAIGAPMIFFFLNLNLRTSSFMQRLARVDWFGAVLFVAATTGFLIPITWGGVQYPWDSWRTLVPLIVCGLGLVGFVVYEEYWAAEPLINTAVFKNRTAAVSYLQDFIHGMLLWCILYYLPLYYEAVKGYSTILSGVALFPQTFTVAPAAGVVGFMIAKTGRYRWAIWSGWFLMTLGNGLLIFLKVDTSVPAWIFLNLVGGLGGGILFPSMALAIQASSTAENQAYAVTMFTFFRAFGQTVGVAIGGVIFQNQIFKKLQTYPALAGRATELSQDASALVQIIRDMPETAVKEQLKESYVYGLRYVFIVLTALSAVALISSIWTEGLSLDQGLDTEQGFQHKKKDEDEEK
jgi:MFS family permease